MTLSITVPAVSDSSSAAKPASAEQSFWGKDGPSFKDALDSINPLQQLPIVSTIYREQTGDTISAASRLIGGALLGGPLGLMFAFINTAIEAGTGKDIGGNIAAAFGVDDSKTTTETKVASNDPVGAPPPTNRAAYEAYQKMNAMMT